MSRTFVREVVSMPRKILDTCIACGSCAAECPVECISEGDIYVGYVIIVSYFCKGGS